MLNRLRKYVYIKRTNRGIDNFRKSMINTEHSVVDPTCLEVKDMRKYNFSLSESYIYDLAKNDYREYINTWEAYQPRMNLTPYSVVSDDKLLFSLVFGRIVEVPETLALVHNGSFVSFAGSGVTEDNVYDYFLSHNGGVIKDRGGFDGFSVFVLSVDGGSIIYKDKVLTKEDIGDIIKNLKSGIIQTRVIQGKFENAIFDKSINTLRIVSVKKHGGDEHEIIAALQRIGTKRSMPVDNFNQGGGSAIIDIKTGELSSMTCIDSFDKEHKRIFYDCHPDTGAPIKGQFIPGWNDIKSKIVEMTRELPLFNFVAWDVVLKDDGIALIEINAKSSLNVFQVHGGMRNSYLGEKYREYGYIKDNKQ